MSAKKEKKDTKLEKKEDDSGEMVIIESDFSDNEAKDRLLFTKLNRESMRQMRKN